MYFHNVYAPVEDNLRADFFSSLPRDFGDDSIHIIGGDFNFPMDTSLDATTLHNGHNAGKAECCAWLGALRVVDAWRHKYPTAKALSGPGGHNRLDYIYIDESLFAVFHASSTYNANNYHGDHLTHTTTLSASQAPAIKPKQKLWRLPRELLQNPNVTLAIKTEAQSLLDELILDPTCNAGAKWAGWLKRIRSLLKQCHYNRQKYRSEALAALKQQATLAKHRAQRGDIPHTAAETAKSTYTSAKAEWRQECMDAGFDHHANQNETATSHFLRRPPSTKTPITSAVQDGRVTQDPTAVAAVFTRHWRSIMTTPEGELAPDPALQQRVIDHIQMSLSLEERELLDRPIEVHELVSALKCMNPKKSPGPDGWPAAFFQVAPETFAAILVRVFNEQRTRYGRLLSHQRRSAVTLLYKNGERVDPGNYRPISLMSVEVKILSKVLAYRLSSVATSIIHSSQAGFIPGRSMRDHIHLLDALQHKATRDNEEWYATFLDFAKAYDRVNQQFLLATMKKMNIGPHFLEWVRLLYKQPESQLLINGSLGPTISPNRGVKQGCPLSCLLFDIYIEPLGALLRAEPHLGIPMPDGSQLTSVFFADDSTILSNSLESADHQVDSIVGTFCAASGAALNISKCSTLVLNSNEDAVGRPSAPNLNVAPTKTPIKYLGVYLGHNLDRNHQTQLLHDKYLNAFTRWACRARTVRGRRTLATTMILSLVWYITAVRPIPDETIVKWQRALSNFILGSKSINDPNYRPLIHKSWHHHKSLGLGIPHIASTIRAQRLRALQTLITHANSQDKPAWIPLVLGQFARCLSALHRASHPFDFLWCTPAEQSHWLNLNEVHPFWLDVWSSWHRVPVQHKLAHPLDFQTILDLPMWLTSHPAFIDNNGRTAAHKASTAILRRWCIQGAANGIHCLRDVLKTGVGGFWPTFDQFRAAMSSNNPEMTVSMFMGRIRFDMILRSISIYDHFTTIFDNLRARLGIRQDVPTLHQPTTTHGFLSVKDNNRVPFELWKRRAIIKAAFHGPDLSRPHPCHSASRPTHASAFPFMRKFRQSSNFLAPVHADVWFRIILRMIPVNSRFAFRQQNDPNSILCSHSCGEIETEEHTFSSCRKVEPLWRSHNTAWHSYRVKFAWDNILNFDSFQVNPTGLPYKDDLHRLWFMLVGVCLHLVWRHHNLALHQSKQMPPPHVMLELSFLLWMATVRRWLRQREPDDPERSSTTEALRVLLRQPLYANLLAKHPRSLELASTFDVH